MGERGEWIGAAEAAQRLGVKPATLYAYVSRGVLHRRRGPDGRRSLFDPAEIDRLAGRGEPGGMAGRTRPRRSGPAATFVIESAVTEISGGGPRYRGVEVTRLALWRPFEEVAEWLWTGTSVPSAPELPSAPASAASRGHAASLTSRASLARPDPPGRLRAPHPASWQAAPEAVAAGTAAQAGLPATTLPLERLQVIVPAMAATDPFRRHLDAPAVIAAGRGIIAGMVDCLPDARALAGPAAFIPAARPGEGGIAGRLWYKICPRRPDPGLLGAVRAALTLLADHELAASTVAARVAASVRADPYAVVATGLGALGGAPGEGGGSLSAETMLAAVRDPGDAARVVGDYLRRGQRLPGFGGPDEGGGPGRPGDPRTALLLELTGKVALRSARYAAAAAVLDEVRRGALPEPNIDFALAVLASVAGMIPGAGEAIFAVARTSGWIAHALEEYARDVPLRPRAVYTGPPAPVR
jgi:citrate synthase